jgi:NADH-quinone oxidoreductase subunit L
MTLLIATIPLFPLLGFLMLGLGHQRIPKKVASLLGPAMILIPFTLSLYLFFNLDRLSISPVHHLFSWIAVGPLRIDLAFLIDPLSVLMMLVVTGVGFLIHVYSIGYMHDDPGYNRFFSYMNLFVFFMLLLVMGASYPVMFIGWEGVGLSSYLLIGFWFKTHEYNNAAKKAFIMNRIGDLGFLVGMFLIFNTFSSLDYLSVFSMAREISPGHPALVAITLLLFVGAVGKSAQIPLYTWLPDAMAGPTPVSALIHAATMVTAGIYMVARSGILYVLSPVTMTVIGIVAVATALLAAVIALYQNDIKKVLAYSTVSQLGYMFAGLSTGAFTGAMFHLTTHAFFKALLFLGAGSVIHALGGEQDIRRMGGLRKSMPVTFVSFLVATLAISGLPPFSGFFSKDEILIRSFSANPLMWGLLTTGALLTTFYMFRLFWLTFFNTYRGPSEQPHHLHESPAVMTIPLAVLASLALFGGVLNIPSLFGGNQWLEHFLSPVFADAEMAGHHHPHLSHQVEWTLTGVTVVLVLGMIAWSYRRFNVAQHGLLPDDTKRSVLVKIISEWFYVDEMYDLLVCRPMKWLSLFLHRVIETRIIDRAVNGVGRFVIVTGNTLRYIQTGNVGFYMFIMVMGIILILFLTILA